MKPLHSAWILLALLLLHASGAGARGERLANLAAGVSLEPPTGWTTLAERALTPQAVDVRLPDDALIEALRALEGRPLVELAKHAEPYPDLNPTIQINLRPLGGFAGRPLAEVMSTVVIPLRGAHPDLELEGAARAVKVAGLDAFTTTTRYSIASDGRKLDVRSHLWVVPRGALYFVIGMTEPPQGSDVAKREFERALASIRIEP